MISKTICLMFITLTLHAQHRGAIRTRCPRCTVHWGVSITLRCKRNTDGSHIKGSPSFVSRRGCHGVQNPHWHQQRGSVLVKPFVQSGVEYGMEHKFLMIQGEIQHDKLTRECIHLARTYYIKHLYSENLGFQGLESGGCNCGKEFIGSVV